MKFLFIFPFCVKDLPAAKRSAEVINKFGPYPGSHLFIEPTQDVPADEVKIIEGFLNPVFDTYRTVPPFDEAPQKWPEGPNHMFRRAAKWVQNSEFDYYYFWEPDCLPLHRGWLDEFKTEYEAHCKVTPFMGVIHDTKLHNHKTGEVTNMGKHMVGTGLYPKHAPRLAPKAVHPSQGGLAWDVIAQESIVPLAHHTTLIKHNWSTHKYTSLAQIPPEAAVHHGCKDDSLYQLLMGHVKEAETVEPIKGTCPGAEVQLGHIVNINDEVPGQNGAEESPFDTVMPHVLAMIEGLCKNAVTRRKVQKALKKACLLPAKP